MHKPSNHIPVVVSSINLLWILSISWTACSITPRLSEHFQTFPHTSQLCTVLSNLWILPQCIVLGAREGHTNSINCVPALQLFWFSAWENIYVPRQTTHTVISPADTVITSLNVHAINIVMCLSVNRSHWHNLKFRGPCIVIFSDNESQWDV
jgi:hypothetical protein